MSGCEGDPKVGVALRESTNGGKAQSKLENSGDGGPSAYGRGEVLLLGGGLRPLLGSSGGASYPLPPRPFGTKFSDRWKGRSAHS